MVDISELDSDEYINAEVVRNAKDKRAVIISEGEIVDNAWNNKRLQLHVQLDTKTKILTMNTETLRNIRANFGSDTKTWVGKVIMLSTAEKNGKRYVIGFPL